MIKKGGYHIYQVVKELDNSYKETTLDLVKIRDLSQKYKIENKKNKNNKPITEKEFYDNVKELHNLFDINSAPEYLKTVI